MTYNFIRREDTRRHTGKKTEAEISYAAINRGIPEASRSWRKHSPLEPPLEPVNTWISDF